jgi:hypothetical protein
MRTIKTLPEGTVRLCLADGRPPIGLLMPRAGRTPRQIDRLKAIGVLLSLVDPVESVRRTPAQAKTELRRIGFTFVSLPDFDAEMTMAANLLFRAQLEAEKEAAEQAEAVEVTDEAVATPEPEAA